jgi:hypothetical protein
VVSASANKLTTTKEQWERLSVGEKGGRYCQYAQMRQMCNISDPQLINNIGLLNIQVQQLFLKKSLKFILNSERAALKDRVLFTLDFGVLVYQNQPVISPTESTISRCKKHKKKLVIYKYYYSL